MNITLSEYYRKGEKHLFAVLFDGEDSGIEIDVYSSFGQIDAQVQFTLVQVGEPPDGIHKFFEYHLSGTIRQFKKDFPVRWPIIKKWLLDCHSETIERIKKTESLLKDEVDITKW